METFYEKQKSNASQKPPSIELLRICENLLRDAGIADAGLDAELLLAHAVGCERFDLHLPRSVEISRDALKTFFRLLERRRSREPLQYIIGKVDFYGISLDVNGNVLIPRQETEELVDFIVTRLKANHLQWNRNGHKSKKFSIDHILDLGTGSGAIALALAKNFPDGKVLALDASEKALSLATANAAKNGIKNVRFLRSNWFENVDGKFDLIVANPPYLSEEEFENTEKELKNFEPKMALVAGNGGLKDIFKIIRSASKYLHDGGTLALEIGFDQRDRISHFSKKYFESFEFFEDLSRKDRFVLFQRNTETVAQGSSPNGFK